ASSEAGLLLRFEENLASEEASYSGCHARQIYIDKLTEDEATPSERRIPSSMPVVAIQDVGKHDGQEVTLRGWLYNLREAGKLLFPIFRDGTGTIQGVVSLKDQPAAFESLRLLTQESSVIVTGRIHADKRAPGGFEIQITGIE